MVISSDGQFCLSGSWDGTLRLWDLTTGQTTCRFVGHAKDVLSVAFSVDNRQIVSGSRDKTIRLWNTLGECKYVIAEPEGHTEWVSCVRFSPITSTPVIVSGGWDKVVKVWSLANCKLKSSLVGHTGYVNSVTVSPDGSLCASGGKVRQGQERRRERGRERGRGFFGRAPPPASFFVPRCIHKKRGNQKQNGTACQTRGGALYSRLAARVPRGAETARAPFAGGAGGAAKGRAAVGASTALAAPNTAPAA